MIFRLLALNIDGTLLQSNGRLHRSTKEAIHYVQQKGVDVTLVTSRSYPSANKLAKALKINLPIVSNRGAFIANTLEEPIFEKKIDADVAFEIVRFLEGFQCQFRLNNEEYSIGNRSKLTNNLMTKTIFSSADPAFYSHQFVDIVSEALTDTPMNPSKIEVYFEDAEDLDDAFKALNGMFSEINLVKVNKLKLDIVPEGVSKLNGLLRVGEQLGITSKEIVYIGDDFDDIALIDAVGLGVAMGNSSFEVKKAADWVTRSNNQHGVTYMVKEHFRKQPPIEFLRKMNIIKN
ncbi:Cof-type HAD-IIB family hydrolase [Pseudoneobacillus rhizosphaerae]|uniref:Stress response protein YhaX n=1 Tax=Pseudoneobacillus rhizosphaerae TaxID=2880968 RepID=A0A9C7LC34_9BACI|nr:Cof-type HAD-IIB family hydrolase [Pseudoneobacillus rhizosphaerae]CAG9609498.1 Stress response protein YhaX [Pseudoneobacillus rhizosphaerae]